MANQEPSDEEIKRRIVERIKNPPRPRLSVIVPMYVGCVAFILGSVFFWSTVFAAILRTINWLNGTDH